MGLIVEAIVWFIIEVLFWGIMYWTGVAIAKMVTLGKWTLEGAAGKQEKWKETRKDSRFIVVAVLGVFFWLVVALIIVLIKTGS